MGIQQSFSICELPTLHATNPEGRLSIGIRGSIPTSVPNPNPTKVARIRATPMAAP
ncbi:MAG: hypothetical protein Q8O46_01270 [bacterium]|nr:hypothetical protein [bacterium]